MTDRLIVIAGFLAVNVACVAYLYFMGRSIARSLKPVDFPVYTPTYPRPFDLGLATLQFANIWIGLFVVAIVYSELECVTKLLIGLVV